MFGLVLTNNTTHKIEMFGKEGTDWVVYEQQDILPGETRLIAGLSYVPGFQTDHWGWIFFRLDDTDATTGQLYMSAGSDRGLYDYCVQPYDGGKNRNGDTMPNTKVELLAPFDGCVMSIQGGFNAK
jgi:hypothetical protein